MNNAINYQNDLTNLHNDFAQIHSAYSARISAVKEKGILEKGQDNEITHQPNPYSNYTTKRYNKNHILIKPINIGLSKMKQHVVFFKSGKQFHINNIADYPFWIARKFIRRGPNSWSQKKDRWIMQQVFEFCIARAVSGNNNWENPFVWPHCMKDPYK